jgi:hypothetical protein
MSHNAAARAKSAQVLLNQNTNYHFTVFETHRARLRTPTLHFAVTIHAAAALYARRSSAWCAGQGVAGDGGVTSRFTGAGAAAGRSDDGDNGTSLVEMAAAPTRQMWLVGFWPASAVAAGTAAEKEPAAAGASLSALAAGQGSGADMTAGPTRHIRDDVAGGAVLRAETAAAPTRHV